MGAEQQKIISEKTDSFREKERNWTGEVLKRSHNEVKCRIFLKGGKCPALFRWALSPKVPPSDQQMLILLKALSSRRPQTARTTAKALQLRPTDMLHTFMRKQAN